MTWTKVAVPGAILIWAIMLAGLALFFQQEARLDARVTVIETSDPQSVGATSQIVVEVANHMKGDLRPQFSVQWSVYPRYWRRTSGPADLPAGRTATYVIEAPDAAGALPPENEFRVRVNDGSSIVYALSDVATSSSETMPIANPSFALWGRLSTGGVSRAAPIAWYSYLHIGSNDDASISPIDSGSDGVLLQLRQDGSDDEGPWAHAGLRQEIDFPSSPLSITVRSETPFQTSEEGWPTTAFGIEITDDANPMLWFVFSSEGGDAKSYDLPNGHHVVVVEVPDGQWATRTIDVGSVYRRLGWTIPDRLELKVFIAATSGRPGFYAAEVSDLSLTELAASSNP